MRGLTTPVAAANWAMFSGDWNPIHFDLEAAKAVGADRLVVHGMLALLEVKETTSSRIKDDQSEQQFNAFFRIPALQGSSLRLDIRQKVGGVNFGLQADDYLCIRGNHGIGEAWTDVPLVVPDSELRKIPAETVASKYSQFHSLFPFVSHNWIYLDALVFSDFLGDYFKTDLPLSKGFAPVQMSHRVKFNAALVGALNLSGSRSPALHYTLRRIEGPSEGVDRFGIAVLTVFSELGPLMQTEVGLLAKTISQPQLDLQIE